MSDDRRIHASNDSDQWDIVRYDRAGKWWVEWRDAMGSAIRIDGLRPIRPNLRDRAPITAREAATIAVHKADNVRSGLIGGNQFDALVLKELAAKRTKP